MRNSAEDRRAVLERRHAQNQAKARLALALVGVSVFNSFAPVWGPAIGDKVSHPTRSALERIIAQPTGVPTHGPLSTLDAQCLQLRRAPLIQQADAELQAVDRALHLPAGTARLVAVERALVDAGVDPVHARDATHLLRTAASTTDLLLTLQRAVDEGRVDLTRLGLAGADAIDRIVTDPHLSLAFAAGAALAPRIPVPAAGTLSALGRVGHVMLNAKLRHDHAIAALKTLHTGNAIVDVAGRLTGELADLTAFALAFLGPGPLFSAARGADLLLVAGHLIAAKTAVAGSLKAIGSYTDLPGELVAFALGVAAETTAQHAAQSLQADAATLALQRDTLAHGIAEAAQAQDPQKALDAVLAAWDVATPHERDALRQLIVIGSERIATDAGVAPAAS